MKLSRIFLSFIIGLTTCLAATSSVQAVTISENGQAAAVIVVPAGSSITTRHAAAELSQFLGEVTGGTFEIVERPAAGKSGIYVGPEAAKLIQSDFSTEGLGTDGIILQTAGKNLILAGGEPRGTLYAVYTFLEDTVGCRWWTYNISHIPKKPTLVVDDLNVRYVPQFELREIMFMPYTQDGDWSVRNKCIGELHGYGGDGKFTTMPERGGALKAWPCGHSYYIVLPPEKYFDKHPEWYSLIDGKRVASPSTNSSLCLTNKQMLAEFIKNTKIEARRGDKLWPVGTRYIAVSPPDDSGYPSRCQCENCVAVEEYEQSATGPVLKFANQVAAAIEKEFPDKYVYFYAYHYAQKPPLHEKPRKNVIPQFAPINASYSVPITNNRNARWRDDLIAWTQNSDRTYVYEYPINVTYEVLPHPNLRNIWEGIKFYADHGVRGYYAEASYGDREKGGVSGQEFAELRIWVMAKLLWNPSLDPDALVREFTTGFYGHAGEEIINYLDIIHNAAAVSGDWLGIGGDEIAYTNTPNYRFLSIETMIPAWASLEAAEQAVKDDPVLLARVKTAQLPMKLVFLCRWNELRDAAANRGMTFPLTGSFEENLSQFMQTAETNRVLISPGTRMLLTKAKERMGMAP